tara:strand:- start:918 stop:3059 length:2142 start_codon:yes stop_codon:yes gene_type:complete
MAGNRFRQIIEVIMKGAGKVASDSKKVQKGLQGVAKDAAKIGAAFYAAKGSINATQNFVSSALKVENLAPAFNKLGAEIGFTSNSMQKLKDATNDTMSEVELMKVANQAMTLGIVDSDVAMADLFDTAQRLGKSLGVDTVSALDSLVTGMGRQSILMLDNLGIIVDVTKANEDYAEQMGIVDRALTEAEKKQAFNNAALEAAQEKVSVLGAENETSADTFAKFQAAADDFSASLGRFLLPMLTDIANAAVEVMNFISDLFGMSSNVPEMSDFDKGRGRVKEIGEITDASEQQKQIISLLTNEWSDYVGALDITKITYDDLLVIQQMATKSQEYWNTELGISIPSEKRRAELLLMSKTSFFGLHKNMEQGIKDFQDYTLWQEDLNTMQEEVPEKIADMIDQQRKLRGEYDESVKAIEKAKEEMEGYKRQIEIATGVVGESVTEQQLWIDEQLNAVDTLKVNDIWMQQFIENHREAALALGMLDSSQMTFNENFEIFAQQQQDSLDAQQLQQDMIDHLVIMYPELAEQMGLKHSLQLQEIQDSKDQAAADKEQADEKKKLLDIMKQNVDAAMALGAASTHVGQAAADAAGVYIIAEIQKALASRLASAFAKPEGNFWVGMAAVATSAMVGSLMMQGIQSVKAAATGMDEVVTEPTLILAGEEGAEYVNIEPTQNEGAGMGGGGQIVFQGNVLSKDFIEDEAIPMIKEALRRGHSI